MQEKDLIPQLFKTEYRKIVSVLCKLFGLVHIEIAEDIANDTFLLAAESWGSKGVPEHPVGWLYTVAKNKTRDYLKRNTLFNEKVSVEVQKTQSEFEEVEIDLSAQNINDSQLQMIFALCNPVIPSEAQIGLALRILCGFGIEEIAEAFLSNKETINKRLFRAKEKLRENHIQIQIPEASEIDSRLENVLTTLYLLFNEGYYSATQNVTLRKDLCLEAMRLNYFLIENAQTNTPAVNALMSLMCFHASRFAARTGPDGSAILYDAQDRELWDDGLILKGNHYLIESAKGQEISKYHLEASIAYWHCTKTEPDNKWDNILQLYNQLLLLEYSPMAALNRTYALSKVYGKELAAKEAEKLDLGQNHLYFTLLGYLYTEMAPPIAESHFKRAYNLAKTAADRQVISQYLHQLKSPSGSEK